MRRYLIARAIRRALRGQGLRGLRYIRFLYMQPRLIVRYLGRVL